MAGYVDGFVIPLKKSKLALYRRIAEKAGKIWREYGALDYKECICDDPGIAGMVSFPQYALFYFGVDSSLLNKSIA